MKDLPYIHCQNHDGYSEIQVGTRKLTCIGDLPPLDHPHIYLTISATSVRCPYCSTLYVYNSSLGVGETNPASCTWTKDDD